MKKTAFSFFSTIAYRLLLLGISLAILASCQDEAEPGYQLSGKMVNVTGLPVRNASITLTGSNNVAGGTNNDGEFSVNGLEMGTYEVSIQRDGFPTYEDFIEITGDMSRDFTLVGEANISGSIVNSQTGEGLENASVMFYTGNDTTAVNAELQTQSDFIGDFEIVGAPTGNFTIVVRASGFYNQQLEDVAVTAGTNELNPITIVETVEEGEIRIVLTWGASPRDLDSHLTGPEASGDDRFHMYFFRKRPVSYVNLDVDDVTGFGPETTTITSDRINGTYRYSVHNYSYRNNDETGIETLASSGAKVEVYDQSGLIASFEPPVPNAGELGTVWRVFEFDATNSGGSITAINEYRQIDSFSNTANFRNGEKEATSFNPIQF